jgi:hypothetical protein
MNTQTFLEFIMVSLVLTVCVRITHLVGMEVNPSPGSVLRDVKKLTVLQYRYFFVLFTAIRRELVRMSMKPKLFGSLLRRSASDEVESVQISNRQYRILIALAVASRPLLGVDIHEKAQVPLSEVYALLRKLVQLSLLSYDVETSAYTLAPSLETVIREELSNDLFQTRQRLQLVISRKPTSAAEDESENLATTRKPKSPLQPMRA